LDFGLGQPRLARMKSIFPDAHQFGNEKIEETCTYKWPNIISLDSVVIHNCNKVNIWVFILAVTLQISSTVHAGTAKQLLPIRAMHHNHIIQFIW
jgi:hypothetical protein